MPGCWWGRRASARRRWLIAWRGPCSLRARLGEDAADAGHKVFRKVAALSHPNLLLIRRSFNDKTKRYSQWIGVDEVRRLRAFLGHSAGEAGWRVVIVDRADELNQNAANALLKALEEPPTADSVPADRWRRGAFARHHPLTHQDASCLGFERGGVGGGGARGACARRA